MNCPDPLKEWGIFDDSWCLSHNLTKLPGSVKMKGSLLKERQRKRGLPLAPLSLHVHVKRHQVLGAVHNSPLVLSRIYAGTTRMTAYAKYLYSTYSILTTILNGEPTWLENWDEPHKEPPRTSQHPKIENRAKKPAAFQESIQRTQKPGRRKRVCHRLHSFVPFSLCRIFTMSSKMVDSRSTPPHPRDRRDVPWS